MNIVGRFLPMKVVQRKELLLVGISAMLIACKYEEIWAPEVNNFVFISYNAYAREQVLVMEKAILDKLEWYLTVPTPYMFLVRFIKASIPSDDKMGFGVLPCRAWSNAISDCGSIYVLQLWQCMVRDAPLGKTLCGVRL